MPAGSCRFPSEPWSSQYPRACSSVGWLGREQAKNLVALANEAGKKLKDGLKTDRSNQPQGQFCGTRRGQNSKGEWKIWPWSGGLSMPKQIGSCGGREEQRCPKSVWHNGSNALPRGPCSRPHSPRARISRDQIRSRLVFRTGVPLQGGGKVWLENLGSKGPVLRAE